MRRCLSLLWMLLSVCCGYADDARQFKNIGLKEGLSNGFANDMVIDRQGFIWVATESGLDRIAGNKCTVFKTHNSYIDSDDHVGLYYDREANTIWIHFKNGHIDLFNCNTQSFRHFENEKGMLQQSVADISEAKDGGVWIAYHNGSIQHYNPTTHQFRTLDSKLFPKIKNGIRTVADDGSGHLYIGSRMDGMYVYNLNTKKARFFCHQSDDPQSLPGNNVRSVYIDHAKNIWVGTNLGLGLFDAAAGTFRVFRHAPNRSTSLAGDNIHQIMEMDDNTLWIASDIGGISVLDLKRYKHPATDALSFSQLTRENGRLSSNNTRRIVQDAFGNIWIAHYSSGIDFIPRSSSGFHTLSYQGKSVDNTIGLFCDRQGYLWIGQDNAICRYKAGQAMQSWDFSSYLSNSSATVYVFEEDKDGGIWIGTNDNGVLKFDPKTGRFVRINCARYLDVHALHEDAQGKMWIGSEAGLYSVEHGREKEEKELNKQMGSLSSTIIYSITEDNYGQLWVCTIAKGVYVFDRQKRLVAHLEDSQSLKSNSVNHIIKDADGGIWLATFNGLVYIPDPLRPTAQKIYDERQGIKDSHIRAVCQDRQGNIWVSMFSGIACFNTHKQRFYNYDYQSGIPTGNFVEASAVVSSDGTVYFGSPGGICYFDPRQMTVNDTVSSVEIIDCERVGRLSGDHRNPIISLDENGTIRLKYNDNTFKINFTANDFAKEGDVEYSYMMKGLDNQWYETEEDNEVTFRNLKPGSYTFVLRAKLKNQDWTEASTTSLQVRVSPPLWLTWWAKLCYLSVLLGFVWYVINSYKRGLMLRHSLRQTQWESQQKQELNEERLRFFTNITHELRTPLTLIMGPLEDLTENKELPVPVQKKIGSIHASAERLLNLINDILEFRKTQTQNRKLTVARADIGAWVKEIGTRFQDLNHNPNVSIFIHVQPDLPTLYFDSEVIDTIINNLMSNAIKYTPNGSITLSVYMTDAERMTISVADTGYGIDPKALPHIFDRYYKENGKHQASGTGIGLALVKSLAELHEAELQVESSKGQGCKFTFTLHTGNTYPDALHKDDESAMDVLPISDAIPAEENDDTSAATPGEVERPLLLIVEDNSDIRQYIAESLREDYRLLQADNGREGRDLAFAQIPDLIVSDIMMPEMDGIEMTHQLKVDIRTSHIPVILLTAKTSLDDQETGYDSGADSYLTKPFSAKLLRSRIKNLLASRHRLVEYLTREHTAETEVPTMPLNPLDQRFMDKLNKLIADHITTDDLDMAFMTDRMAMSQSTFYRKVKALTEMSPNEYIKKAKLRHSMVLLKSREYNVTEVATMAGFNNLGNFRESFKREFGCTPSDVLKA